MFIDVLNILMFPHNEYLNLLVFFIQIEVYRSFSIFVCVVSNTANSKGASLLILSKKFLDSAY